MYFSSAVKYICRFRLDFTNNDHNVHLSMKLMLKHVKSQAQKISYYQWKVIHGKSHRPHWEGVLEYYSRRGYPNGQMEKWHRGNWQTDPVISSHGHGLSSPNNNNNNNWKQTHIFGLKSRNNTTQIWKGDSRGHGLSCRRNCLLLIGFSLSFLLSNCTLPSCSGNTQQS